MRCDLTPTCTSIAAPQRDSSRSPARLNWHSLQILAKKQGFSHGVRTTPLLLLITCSNQENEVEPIVRAVDIGRGNTKFIATVSAGEVRCAMFPSQAHPCETIYEQETWGTKRRTVCVPVDDLNYEVGPDAHLASDIFNANVLQHDSYSATPEYPPRRKMPSTEPCTIAGRGRSTGQQRQRTLRQITGSSLRCHYAKPASPMPHTLRLHAAWYDRSQVPAGSRWLARLALSIAGKTMTRRRHTRTLAAHDVAAIVGCMWLAARAGIRATPSVMSKTHHAAAR